MSEIKDVKWEGQYGFLEGGLDGKCFWDGGGMGITYAPVCPHCGEFAYEESECVFCHGKYNLDWSKQPPAEPEQDEDKSILMSIKSQWVAKILNGEKTIEVRKRFPKDFVGWVYIYCTKAKPYLANARHFTKSSYKCLKCDEDIYKEHKLNGKIVARFWCDGVMVYNRYKTVRTSVIEATCLRFDDLIAYSKDKDLHFIHISNLEIFDEPVKLKGNAPQSWRYL